MELEPTDLATDQEHSGSDDAGQDGLDEELLIEEISIDGMCGVY